MSAPPPVHLVGPHASTVSTPPTAATTCTSPEHHTSSLSSSPSSSLTHHQVQVNHIIDICIFHSYALNHNTYFTLYLLRRHINAWPSLIRWSSWPTRAHLHWNKARPQLCRRWQLITHNAPARPRQSLLSSRAADELFSTARAQFNILLHLRLLCLLFLLVLCGYSMLKIKAMNVLTLVTHALLFSLSFLCLLRPDLMPQFIVNVAFCSFSCQDMSVG